MDRLQTKPALVVAFVCVVVAGCHGPQLSVHAPDIRPREGAQTPLPAYTVNPPDILRIEMEGVPSEEHVIEPGDTVMVNVANTLPEFPIAGPYFVQPNGQVDLGPEYGTVSINGLTVTDAEEAIREHLLQHLAEPEVSLATAGARPISGEYLVRPDGTVKLGFYGAVRVAGLTPDQIEDLIGSHLEQEHALTNPKVSVDIIAYNSMVYYIVSDGAGFGDQVTKLPITGNETVLDAISEIGGMPQFGSKSNIWIARPAPHDPDTAEILPVDWVAITKTGMMSTNYQILPGDRIFIKADNLIVADNTISKVLAPIERVLGSITLFRITINALSGQGFGQGGQGGFGGGF